MTKAEIVTKIAKQTGLDKDTVLSVVEQFMNTVKESLTEGEPVFLRGFGSFIIKERSQKLARNISAEKGVIVPAHNIPFFKPCSTFKEMMAPELKNIEK